MNYVVFNGETKVSDVTSWRGVRSFLKNSSLPIKAKEFPFFVAPNFWVFEVVETNDQEEEGINNGKYYHYVVPPVFPSDEEILQIHKESAYLTIDTETGQVRAKYITNIFGQESAYYKKEAEARAYAQDPTASYPFLEAEANYSEITIEDLVASILKTTQAWALKEPIIEGVRRGGKSKISRAVSVEDVDSILNETLTNLQTI